MSQSHEQLYLCQTCAGTGTTSVPNGQHPVPKPKPPDKRPQLCRSLIAASASSSSSLIKPWGERTQDTSPAKTRPYCSETHAGALRNSPGSKILQLFKAGLRLPEAAFLPLMNDTRAALLRPREKATSFWPCWCLAKRGRF